VNSNRLTLHIALALACGGWFGEPVGAQSAPRKPPLQSFVCNTGYSQSACQAQVSVLRTALAKYPIVDLGDWTWVVVRSIDWKRLLADRKFAPDIPAFTYLPRRETYIDEALLGPASSRGFELAESWHMTMPELLDLAIRHEMGHALCNERDEAAAKRTAQLLLEAPAAPALQACRDRKPKT
jgi:hypothetical protein